MTPLPLAKTPVRLVEAPAVIDAGLAAKLVIAGAAAAMEELALPVRLANDRQRKSAHKVRKVLRCIIAPLTQATKRTSVLQHLIGEPNHPAGKSMSLDLSGVILAVPMKKRKDWIALGRASPEGNSIKKRDFSV
jgi:hypothetical protein